MGDLTIAVGLDVDGVVANFVDYAIVRLGLDPALNKTWDFAPSYGEEVAQQARDICNDPATWVSLEPMPDAKHAVFLMRSIGIVPVFVTSMPERFRMLREWWLHKHFRRAFGQYPIYLFIGKGEDKPGLALEQGLTHFVEDKRETANAMAEAGLTSILVPRSYTYDGDIDPRVQVMPLMSFAMDVYRKTVAVTA